MEAPGIESLATSPSRVVDRRVDDADHATQDDERRLKVSALSRPGDPVEAALSRALYLAAEAGRFDVVAQLAGELEARRRSRTGNVVKLPRRRQDPW